MIIDDTASSDAMSVGDSSSRVSRLPFTVVGIGASAGGLEAFIEFFDAMPSDKGMAFVLIQHLSPKHESMVAEILQKHTAMRVRQVDEGMPIEPDNVYVIRPGHTLTMRDGKLHLGESLLKAGHSRPVDDFFRSLAEEQGERSIGILLSGMGSNGSAGAQAIKVVGGMCIAQEPESAKYPSMPRNLIDSNLADFILKPAEIPDVLIRYTAHTYISGEKSAALIARRESQQLAEILAILRARVRHDFTGYKKPTLVRRIQRRMGLTQHTAMADYARMLRQTPAEVVNLSDDLMIHVTGFFRDPEVWETLREKVINPLVAERQDQGSIRAWVTACASGEEAYSIAMLLLEASESADKRFDIKVFATDMAERGLAHARAGIYPGGIESEISPHRLARFFDKDDSMYRIKKEVRELVVFAPQNVLQDPPFSRLDIATCRNLMIYLEPEVQQKVLSLLHFGLREGGTLVLGNSETIGEKDDLFEPIDKKNRIYRRMGPTRHGALDFPLPSTLSRLRNEAEPNDLRPLTRASLAQITNKVLLDAYTPPSIVVDRHGRIVYFHGATEVYLDQPRGEPTREVLVLARDFVRGAIRIALQRAIETEESVTIKDGLLPDEEQQLRVEVTAAPLDRRGMPDYYLITFTYYPVTMVPTVFDGNGTMPSDVAEELKSVRDELQSTIEELQTSNEEMKASHEEVTSVNEELQSTNEELETSKEELQSLNEELTTVNAQLQDKMEELGRTGNDLASLLASSDTAVIFLDRQFRIRRYTPATKLLIELIPTDIGRPLVDLALHFDDPTLMDAAAEVLATLVSNQATITNEAGNWYVRRILPYRTTDDRIDGVVITFADVTELKRAEAAVRLSEGRLRTMADAAPVLIWQTDEGGVTFLNRHYLEFVGRPYEAVAGTGWADFLHPDDAAEYLAGFRAAFVAQHEFESSCRFRRHDGEYRWLHNIATPHLAPDGKFLGFMGCSMDVTDRKGAEQRQDFLLKLSDALGPLADPVAMQVEATRVLGEYLKADRVLYAEVESDQDHITIHRDFTAAGIASIAGRQRLSSFGPYWIDGYRAGRTLATSDFRDIGGSQADAFEAIGVRACVGVPINKNGKFVGILIVHSAKPRQWTPLEIGLIEATMERTWAAVEWAQSQTALRETEIRNSTLLANLPYGAAFVVDTNLRYVLAEGQALADAGFTSTDLVGKTLAEALPAELAASYEPYYRAALAGETFRHEHTAHDRTYATHGGPLRDASGRIYAAMAVSYDITDRKRAEADRTMLLKAEQQARAAAESANSSKDQFLANASHELRTPLSAILLWLTLLQSEKPDEATLTEGLASIEHSARSQQKLIEDLLDTARISIGKIRLDLRPTLLTNVVSAAVDTIRPTAAAKGVIIDTDFGDDIGSVLADADRLQQVIWNLVNNAVKFTPSGGHVKVGLWRRGKEVEVDISDTGQGIAPELLSEVFARFSQADSSMTRRHGGLGLGLSIARQMTELHGGTITAASEGIGKGATFTVVLPLPRARHAVGVKKPRGPASVDQKLNGINVLLIEDDPMTREALSRTMERAGATVESAETADAGLEAFAQRKPDIVVSDIGLPDKDGYTLIRELREAEVAASSKSVPVLALSAFQQQKHHPKSLASGFTDYLTKPVEPLHLIATLRRMLDQT